MKNYIVRTLWAFALLALAASTTACTETVSTAGPIDYTQTSVGSDFTADVKALYEY